MQRAADSKVHLLIADLRAKAPSKPGDKQSLLSSIQHFADKEEILQYNYNNRHILKNAYSEKEGWIGTIWVAKDGSGCNALRKKDKIYWKLLQFWARKVMDGGQNIIKA